MAWREEHVSSRIFMEGKRGEWEWRESRGRSPDTVAFVSSHPLRGGWLAKGWITRVGDKEREDFNVCLPREAIKINTSNYQAVLNFLAATTIAVRRLSPLPPSPIARSSPIPRKFFLHRSARRISLHSRAFTLPWIPQLRGGGHS